MKAEGFRAELVDGSSGQLGSRIRRAKTEKVPYMLVVGDTDVENGTVGVNRRGSERARARRHGRRRSSSSSPPKCSSTGNPNRAVGLERLWADWRSTYVSTEAGRDDIGCVLCNLIAATDDAEALVLERTPETITVMNLYPYGSGHLMVAPIRHEAAFDDLSDDGERRDRAGSGAGAARDPRRVLARRRERRREPRPGGRRRGARRTCTCTCCPAGTATPTS